jgi:DNA-binding transcriptional LysR family regulator
MNCTGTKDKLVFWIARIREGFDMRSLNLDHLRALLAVAEAGSFSDAARHLNLSQPAVSQQIHELEARCGVSLLERNGRHVVPTSAGKDLIAQAVRIEVEVNRAIDVVRRHKTGCVGRVRVGTTLTAMTYELPPIVSRLRKEYPGIDLIVTNMPTCYSVDNILKNSLDLALVTLPVSVQQLRVTPLRREILVAIFPADAKDVPDEVTPEYVARQTLVIEHARGAVHGLIMQWLSEHLPLADEPAHIGVIEAVKAAVVCGLGMSIVPDVAVAEPRADMIVRRLRPPVPCTLGLIEHRSKANEPALEVVRNALLQLRTM